MSVAWAPKPVERVAVVGMGTMGMQIAALSACAGYETHVYDGLDGAVERALKRLAEEVIPGIVGSGMNPAPTTVEASLARLAPASSLEAAVSGVDLVIEAVKEDIDVKLEVFAELSRFAPEAILATGSSSLLSRPLADVVSNPRRLLNMHFFAPVWVRSMVELMTCGQTDEAVFVEATKVGKAMGLVVARVQGESKGFIINRVWRAIKRESLRVVDEGHATPEDVDRLFMLFFEAGRAPFSTMDTVGLDVVADIERSYHAVATDPADVPIPLLTEKVASGELGEKTGKGFYIYPNPSHAQPDFVRPRDEKKN
jgi:3-hydroxybutyryl-CoA dehydrogenase